jgi:small neutral amino acid transporter SnatA (MarC family)
MRPFTAGPFVTDLLIGYMTLFSIINPFGALSGWSMLAAPDESTTSQAAPTCADAVEGMAFFPLTIPSTTGLGANRTGELRAVFASVLTSLLVAVLVAATITVAWPRISRQPSPARRRGFISPASS